MPKRRIYDITNVLEGVGLVQKVSKSMSRWVGPQPLVAPPIDESEDSRLQQEERRLDYWISQMEGSIAELARDPSSKELSYLTLNDVRSVMPHSTETALSIYTGTSESVQVTEDSPGTAQIQVEGTPLSINIIKNSLEEGSSTGLSDH